MGDFEIFNRDVNDIAIIDIKGYLDAHTAPEFEQGLQDLVDASQFKIVVNCNDLSYISSAGLGVFMEFIEEVRENNGDIKLSNMNNRVYKVFDLLGFPNLYEIYKKEEEAVKKFNLSSSKDKE